MISKALLIGINYEGTRSELHGCINDVNHMKQFLMEEYQAQPQMMHVLTDKTSEKPTRKNIIKGFQWLVEGVTNKSVLFLHYSGHGGSVRDRNGDEDDGRDETIVPLDYQRHGEIVDDELRQLLVDPLPKGCRLTCIFDCCHSGTVLDLRYNYRIRRQNKETLYEIREDKNYAKTKAHVILFSGCMDKQTSADAWEERQAQGAMTYCWLKTYRREKAKNRKITYKRLFDGLVHFIARKGYQQIPQMSSGSSLVNLNKEFRL